VTNLYLEISLAFYLHYIALGFDVFVMYVIIMLKFKASIQAHAR